MEEGALYRFSSTVDRNSYSHMVGFITTYIYDCDTVC